MSVRNQWSEMFPLGNPFPVDGDRRRYDPLTAMGVSSGVNSVGSVVGGLVGRGAAKSAATAQANAQQKVIDATNQATTQGYFDVNSGADRATQTLGQTAQQQVGQYQPFTQAGTNALGDLTSLAGPNGPLSEQFSFNPTDLQNDAGYKFALDQGQQALQKAAAAKGGLFSSGTLKSLANYSTGTANTYFNDAFNRAQSTFNTNRQGALSRISTLQGLAGMGLSGAQGSANALGSTGAQTANTQFGSQQFLAGLGVQGAQNVGQALTGQGNAQAAGIVGGANALQGAIGGVGNAAADFSIMDYINKNRPTQPHP